MKDMLLKEIEWVELVDLLHTVRGAAAKNTVMEEITRRSNIAARRVVALFAEDR